MNVRSAFGHDELFAEAGAAVVARLAAELPATASLMSGIEDALHALAARFAAWRLRTPEILAYEFVAPIVMARFLFFTVDATEIEMRRGEALVAAHAANRHPELVEGPRARSAPC